MKAALRGAAFFLHTMRDEPFGMSTVEAIAAGCIPVVHDSGGQREVVPLDHLRFRTVEEAVGIFEALLAQRPKALAETSRYLQNHIRQFSRDTFRGRMSKILSQQLSA